MDYPYNLFANKFEVFEEEGAAQICPLFYYPGTQIKEHILAKGNMYQTIF
jgi:hypothetical protein